MSLPQVEGLEFVQEGPVVRATIDRGAENLMSMPMCTALTQLLHAPPVDARVLHLRASGTAFCLGRDRGFGDEAALREESEILVRLNRALREGELVTVAEVAGEAAGYGVGLAALCDLSFAAPSAKFWFPEAAAGLAPTVVLAWLPSLVGRSHAFRLTASGAPVDGREAARLGLVTVVADGDTELAALVGSQIAGLLRNPAQVHREIRSFLRETESAEPSAVDSLAVDRLVAGSLRLKAGRQG